MDRVATKKLPDYPNVHRDCLELVSKHKLFTVWLSPGFFGRNGKWICQNILDPLHPATHKVIIYDLVETHRRVKKFTPYLKKKQRHHILDISERKWEFFLPLLLVSTPFSIIHDLRGSVILECDGAQVDWKSIFKHCCGPTIVSNFRTGCGKNGINYVRGREMDEKVFVFLEQINSGLESISFASSRKTILYLFDIAASSCTLSLGKEEIYEIMERHS